MIRFAENLNKMIDAGLGGPLDPPRTEVAVGHRIQYMDASGPVASFETNIAAPLKKLLVNMLPVQAGSGDPSPENVRPITGRDSVKVWREAAYDPSAAPAAEIALGQTVYSGILDVLTGKLTVYMAAIDMGQLSWSIPSGYELFLSGAIPGVIRKNRWKALCPIYKHEEVLAPDLSDYAYSTSYPDGRIRLNDSRYSNAEDLKSALRGTIFLYEIEPIEINLTPAQLTTLVGDNTVWSDAGDVDVTYQYYEETEGY